MTLQNWIEKVSVLDADAMAKARERQAQLAKPPGSLGRLEDLSVQLADCDFETKAPVGTTVATPSVYLGVYDEDVDVGSNIFKHWFLRYKAPDNMWEDENEPLAQMDMSLLPPLMSECGFKQVTWDLGWWWADQYFEKNNGKS